MDSEEKVLDNSLESTMNMTQDEIEKLLARTESEGMSESFEMQDSDLESLLAGMNSVGDDNVQDISKLLNKADNNEAVDEDVLALLKKQEEPGETAYDAMDLFSGGVPEKEGLLKRILSKFKKKTASAVSESDSVKTEKKKKEKKPKKEKHKSVEGTDTVAEAEPSVKKKKEKRKKDKNSEKKEVAESAEALEELAEIKEKTQSKKEKANKKKKEKPVKEKGKKEKVKKDSPEKIREKEKPTIADAIEELEDEQTEMPHKKKIIMVFVASILVLLGFLVVNHYFTGHANKRIAEEAYEAQDYLECYQLLYGQKLNDNQSAIFHRSEMILKMDIFWRNYEESAKDSKWLEGLDKLTQFVHGYPQLNDYASQWNCQDIAENAYNKVQNALMTEYATDVDTVSEIADLKDDVAYTKALTEIIQQKEKRDEINQKYPDLLPEEEDKVLD